MISADLLESENPMPHEKPIDVYKEQHLPVWVTSSAKRLRTLFAKTSWEEEAPVAFPDLAAWRHFNTDLTLSENWGTNLLGPFPFKGYKYACV